MSARASRAGGQRAAGACHDLATLPSDFKKSEPVAGAVSDADSDAGAVLCPWRCQLSLPLLLPGAVSRLSHRMTADASSFPFSGRSHKMNDRNIMRLMSLGAVFHRYRYRNRYRCTPFQSGHSIAIPMAIPIASPQVRPSMDRSVSQCHWEQSRRSCRGIRSTRFARSGQACW